MIQKIVWVLMVTPPARSYQRLETISSSISYREQKKRQVAQEGFLRLKNGLEKERKKEDNNEDKDLTKCFSISPSSGVSFPVSGETIPEEF